VCKLLISHAARILANYNQLLTSTEFKRILVDVQARAPTPTGALSPITSLGRFLFAPQRLHGIDLGGPARWNIGRYSRDNSEQGCQ
jgi:hypothetical protein